MNKKEFKIYLKFNNKSGYKTREIHIKNKFPVLYNKITNFNGNMWIEKLFNYINDVNVNPKCNECGKTLFMKKYNLGYQKYCSITCLNKSESHKNNVKERCLIKYGVDNPSKSKIVKEKIKNKICRNGIWYVETDEFKNKSKETCLKKYGVNSYSKTKEYNEKKIKTNIKKYGIDSYNKTIESKEKVKIYNIKKYGVEYYMQTNEFKLKAKKTNLIKYGVEHHTQTEDYKNKMKKYYKDKYGVEYYMQTNEFKNRMIITMIERYGEIWLNHAPKYNVNSIIYLDIISERLGISIQHALNGGEKKFIRYWVDGYIEKFNICIEWDEKHHNSKRQKERDNKKELFIKENFNSKIIRIKEKIFMENIEENITLIINQINIIISSIDIMS